MKRLIVLISILILFMSASFAANLTGQPEVKQFISRVAKKYGYSPGYIRYVLNQAHYEPRVIKSMERPYEALPWSQYQKLFITNERIDGGVKYWNRSNKLLAWEKREYAVPPNIIVAIIGIETKYGKQMGDIRVLDSLSTLAFYYPKRASFFQRELAAFIVLTHIYKLNPTAVYGSYAGAMGQPQFMPSTMLHYAVDFHGKGKPNIFTDKADVIFSVGNYLRQHGWEPNQPIAIPAKVVGNGFYNVLKKDAKGLHKPTLSLANLARYGIYPADGNFNPNLKANLIRLPNNTGAHSRYLFGGICARINIARKASPKRMSCFSMTCKFSLLAE